MPSQGVLNVLVKRYLDTSYPAAGTAFDGKCATGVPASQTLESIYGVEPVKAAAKKAVIPDDSSDDEPVKEPVKPVAKKTASPKAAAKKAVIPDDSSDDEPVKGPVKPVAKKTASPKAAAKKAVIPDDSSDDEPVKPVAKKTASPKAAAKKVVADDSSDDEPVKPAAKKTASPKAAAKKVVADDSSSISLPTGAIGFKREREDDKEAKLAWTHVPGQRFQRIDPTKVKFTHDTLRDNSAIELAAQFRQNQEMMCVRGKEFNKHKQKNKGKLYAAGVEMSIRSYKFDDDSE